MFGVPYISDKKLAYGQVKKYFTSKNWILSFWKIPDPHQYYQFWGVNVGRRYMPAGN